MRAHRLIRVADRTRTYFRILTGIKPGPPLADFLKRCPRPPTPGRYGHRILGGVSAEDVLGTYYFDVKAGVPFVDNGRTTFEWDRQGSDLTWRVHLFAHSGASVNRTVDGRVFPIERTLHNHVSLRSEPAASGKVASADTLCLAPRYQGRRLGSLLHERERALYVKWGAREIQLDAGCEAKRTGLWFREGFSLAPARRSWLEVDWEDFQRCTLGITEESFKPLPLDWAKWHPKFRKFIAKSEGTLPLYMSLP
jgi:GNAT superfamily N-acetyltransferase